jgi:hypothetical protein
VVNIRQIRADSPQLKERGVQVDGQSPESQQLSARVVEMAIWILQSMDYLTQDEMKLFGVASACLPFQTACSVLGIRDGCNGGAYSWRYRKIIDRVNNGRYREILIP